MAEDSSSEPEKGRTSSQSSLYATRPPPSPAARPDCLPRFAILTTLNLRKITFQAQGVQATITVLTRLKHTTIATFLSCSCVLQLRIFNSCSSNFASQTPSPIRCCRGDLKRAREAFVSWNPNCSFGDFSSEKLHTKIADASGEMNT